MCGRFVLITDLSVIARDFGISEGSAQFSSSRNVSPGRHIPAVIYRENRNTMTTFLWGLIPSWAKDPSIGAKLINARAETITEKPSFRNAFARRRCLIPADGFYEWSKEGHHKKPYSFAMKSGQPFVFAGLYESWTAPDKKTVETCAIITTQANELVATIHDRMPVIVPGDRQKTWLNARGDDLQSLRDILIPYPAGEMECKPADLKGGSSLWNEENF